MKSLYAVHVVGFPESHAENFLSDVLNSLDGKVIGNTVKVKRGSTPTYCEYAAFFETLPSDPQALSRLIITRIRRYMASRGNGMSDGSYAVTISPLCMEGEWPPVGRYDEATDGYL